METLKIMKNKHQNENYKQNFKKKTTKIETLKSISKKHQTESTINNLKNTKNGTH